MFIIVKVRPWNCIYLFIYCTLGVRILFPNLINNLFINVECGWLKFRSIIYFIWTFSMLWINLPAHSLAWTEATWGVTDCWSSSDRLWKVMSWSGTLTPREDMGRWEKKKENSIYILVYSLCCTLHREPAHAHSGMHVRRCESESACCTSLARVGSLLQHTSTFATK